MLLATFSILSSSHLARPASQNNEMTIFLRLHPLKVLTIGDKHISSCLWNVQSEGYTDHTDEQEKL